MLLFVKSNQVMDKGGSEYLSLDDLLFALDADCSSRVRSPES